MSDASREAVLAGLVQLAVPLNRTLTDPSEIVVHDLSRLPNSIVAVAGKLSGRGPGDRADDVLLKAVAERRYDNRVGYRSRLGDVEVRSSLIFVTDARGEPVAAVSVHYDVSLWLSVRAISEAMLAAREARYTSASDPDPADIWGIEELGRRLLEHEIEASGVPVELMQKRHKLAVVRALRDRGFFALRDGVETVGAALGVSRFTIYNYLNEIEGEGADRADPDE